MLKKRGNILRYEEHQIHYISCVKVVSICTSDSRLNGRLGPLLSICTWDLIFVICSLFLLFIIKNQDKTLTYKSCASYFTKFAIFRIIILLSDITTSREQQQTLSFSSSTRWDKTFYTNQNLNTGRNLQWINTKFSVNQIQSLEHMSTNFQKRILKTVDFLRRYLGRTGQLGPC